MQETLLILHIVAVAAWLGGALVTIFVGPRMGRAGGETSLTWARLARELSMKFFNPAAILVLLTGIGLVLNSDAFGWSDAFVTIGFVAIVLTAILGMSVMAPTGAKVIGALEAGDYPTVGRLAKRIRATSLSIVGVITLTVVFMVLKTGAG